MKQMALNAGIIVDSFAGGGGASIAMERAMGHPVHIAINHDAEAVAMHAANHPYTKHYCEDVFKVDPQKAVDGRPVQLLWASPDCKHFSKAKGGKPVSKKVRGLAWVVLRWVKAVRPEVVFLENVEEFTTWGPLINGKPDPARKGQTFRAFITALEAQGYKVEWRELKACDYGAPTIRKRLFLVARCDGRPIVWPQPTHAPKAKAAMMGLKPYRSAAECIDWSLPCPSIFERNKPLADNTMRRIARGIMKFVVNNPHPFIVPIAHYNGSNPVHDINEPLRTVTASPKGGSFALVNPHIVKVNHGYDQFRGQALEDPMQTMTGKNGYAMVAPVVEVHHGASNCTRADEPLGCILGKQKHALIAPVLAVAGYGEAEGQAPRAQDADQPLGTVVTKQKHAVVAAFLAKHYTGVIGCPVDGPAATITTTDHHSLVTAHVMKMRGDNIGHAADEPLHTITAGGKHYAAVQAFLLKYYGTEQSPDIGDPMHTITTKHRFGLVLVHGVEYQIVDIGMRMLAPHELYMAQGFPPDYVIDRGADGKKLSIAAQVRMCGNSVSPPPAEALIRANIAQSPMYAPTEMLQAA